MSDLTSADLLVAETPDELASVIAAMAAKGGGDQLVIATHLLFGAYATIADLVEQMHTAGLRIDGWLGPTDDMRH